MVVQKVRKQFEGYTKQEMEKARMLFEMQGMVGHPQTVNTSIRR